MVNKKKLISLKRIWTFFVGLSTIASCIIALCAIKEIITLKVEINPVIERIQKDSIVVIKSVPAIIVNEKDTIDEKTASEEVLNPRIYLVTSDYSRFLSPQEKEEIRDDRDRFVEWMNKKYVNKK